MRHRDASYLGNIIMLIKSIYATILLLSIALMNTPEAFAKEIPFEVAIVKNSTGSNEIMAGKFNAGINKLIHKNKTGIKYNIDTGLCVAYLKINDLDKAELSCTAAIKTLESAKSRHSLSAFHKSISYNNRAISRYLNNDISGAIDDLKRAISIDNNRIVKKNINLILEQNSSPENYSTLKKTTEISE